MADIELAGLTGDDMGILKLLIRERRINKKSRQVIESSEELHYSGKLFVKVDDGDSIPALVFGSSIQPGQANLAVYKLDYSTGISSTNRKLVALLNPDNTPYKLNVYNCGDVPLGAGYHAISESASGWWVVDSMNNVDVGGSVQNCGCDCFNCVSDAEATVGACTACPDSAPDQYSADLGVWSVQPQFAGVQIVTWDSGCLWKGPAMVYITNGNWTPLTSYAVGQSVRNGTNSYICSTAGTSASSGGPTGTGSGITDGSVVWYWSP